MSASVRREAFKGLWGCSPSFACIINPSNTSLTVHVDVSSSFSLCLARCLGGLGMLKSDEAAAAAAAAAALQPLLVVFVIIVVVMM